MASKKQQRQPTLLPSPPPIFQKEWTVLEEQYEFVREAGQGKTGVALMIMDKDSKIPFCLKTIAPHITKKSEAAKVADSLRKECEILSPLDHRCLPKVFKSDFGTARPYYICTYHPGETLGHFIKSRKLTQEEAVFTIGSLMSVLEYLHAKGRTHNDLHLQNILIGPSVLDTGILLIDFGSGHRDSDSSENTEARGNIHFMPTRLKAMRERMVNREGNETAFRASDFTAFGHLLATVQDSFFGNMSTAQRAALNAFCTRLISGEFSDWKSVKFRFSSVLEPFRHFEAVRDSFIDDRGLHPGIPLPIYGRVPVGPNWLSAINTKEFQRLRQIKQLSFCDWFFPGAKHSRFEHALGVFNLMRIALDILADYSEVRDLYDEADLKGALLAALFHDLGHYPFAHLVEQYTASRYADDNEILDAASHSRHSLRLLEKGGFCEQIFGASEAASIRNAAVKTLTGNAGVLSDILDGPIDIDKMDYLRRDSHHCGVRFGEGLDAERVLAAIRLSPNGRVAIAASGVNAIEGFLILQNQMLGEVYWHEYTRAVISMFHVALAHIVKTDRSQMLQLIADLKESHDEDSAIQKHLIPRLKGTGKESSIQNLTKLLRLHETPDFKSIYRSLKRYDRTDKPGRKARVSVYAAIMSANSQLSGSRATMNWNNARHLRLSYLKAIRSVGIEAEGYDVIVDVPTGKAGSRSVDVLRDDGEIVPIDIVSHIQKSFFVEPAIFVSPIRVFIAPSLMPHVEAKAERIITAAEDIFNSPVDANAGDDSELLDNQPESRSATAELSRGATA